QPTPNPRRFDMTGTKRTLAFAAVALFSFGTAAMAQDKTYTVAVDGTFAPHAMPNLSGGVEGFNIDLANALGEKLDAKMDIISTQYSGILPGLAAGTYDFVMAPTTMTPERAANLLFAEGYLNTDFQFVVAAGAEDIDTLEGFKGKVISVNK